VAKSFHIFEMTHFPHINMGETKTIPVQLTLEGFAEKADTKVEKLRSLSDGHIDVFRVTHEVVIHTAGRTRDHTFTEFVTQFSFLGYYHTQKRIFILQGKKQYARDAFKTLDERLVDFEGHNRRLDLHSLSPYIQSYRGAWFRMKSTGVNSQALFGPNVGEDPLFDRARSEGQMTNILLYYQFRDDLIPLIGISDSCGVVIYDNRFGEEEEIELVLDVKASLLDLAEERTKSF
jgi:hypothetical protein